MRDIKLFDKVVPHKKTADGRNRGLKTSVCWRNAKKLKQPFLYVTKVPFPNDYQEYLLCENLICNDGDYFLREDFELYKGEND
jgi:hypothetical protein